MNSPDSTGIRLGSVYGRSNDVVARRIADELLLVPIRGNIADLRNVYILHGTGEHIWNLIDGSKPLSAISDCVTASFDVERTQAETDAKELIADLLEAGLIGEVC